MSGFPAGRRDALLIATGTYENPALKPLRSPRQDCEGLAAVLGDPAIGGFAVQQLVDGASYEVKRALEQFFRNRGRDDLLLLHLSCHGIKDDEGHLSFAARDTDKDLPASTAVPAAFLHDQMARCRARTIVVLLDCCYSGAFLPGAKGDDYVQVREELAGHGRAVLTATNRTEYAWEGDHLEAAAPQPSRFTGALIEGLRSGDADTDRDGRITVTELYEYVFEYLHHTGARQRPQMWADLEYRVTLARTATARRTSAEAAFAAAGATAGEASAASAPPPGAPVEGPPPPAQGLFGRLKDAFNGVESETPSAPPRSRRPRRGQDFVLSVEFPLTETALGTVRDIQVDTAKVCDTCRGEGAAAGTPVYPCDPCAGTGEAIGTSPEGGPFGASPVTGTPCASRHRARSAVARDGCGSGGPSPSRCPGASTTAPGSSSPVRARSARAADRPVTCTWRSSRIRTRSWNAAVTTCT